MRISSRNNARLFGPPARHALPLLFFGALTVALTWPAVRDFTTRYIGDAAEDPPHNLWLLWHTKEAFLGRLPLYHAPFLYYPAGISLHLHGIGPLMGLLALPFWPLGPAAAYNGAVLLAFALSGWAVYLLARTAGLSQPAALFSGVLYSVAPIHLGGLLGHLEKIFTALLPLVLLAVLRTLDPRRSRWWAVVTAVFLLLTLLFNGLHFILAALSAAFFILFALARAAPPDRRELFGRALLAGLAALILTGPLLLKTIQAAGNPGVRIDFNLASLDFQPDVLEFVMPPTYSLLFGGRSHQFFRAFNITNHIERFVYLSWTGLVLILIALIRRRRRLWPWLLLAAGWAILALGPTLKLFGDRAFTEYNQPLLLPYALFTMLPGLDFLRTPGRLMLMGFVGFSIAAAIGLQHILDKWPRRRWAVTGLCAGLILLEGWPRPWPTRPVPSPPPFYETLAADPAEYGILNLPLMPPTTSWYVSYSARYQVEQMAHRKGIASGYISRSYQNHPLFPCLIPTLRFPEPDIQVNGRPANCHANILHDLAYYNYRYVIWHKPQPGDGYAANPAEVEASSAYLLGLLSGQTPVVDDNLITVYAIPRPTAATSPPTLGLIHNWSAIGPDGRWATSPASLFISNPCAREMVLTLTPGGIYDPRPGQGTGQEGLLTISLNGRALTQVAIKTGQETAVPLRLEAGVHTLSLTLEAGNDGRHRSFAMQSVNLETAGEDCL